MFEGGAFKTIRVALEASTAGYVGGMAKASSATKDFAAEAAVAQKVAAEGPATTKWEGFVAKTGQLGSSMSKNVTLPILAFAGVAVAAFEQVDHAYHTIEQRTGATGAALKGLKGDFDAVAATTGANFQHVADVMSQLNQRLGLAGKPLQDMTRQFLTLERVAGAGAPTVDQVTKAMVAWNVSTHDQSGELDKLFVASQKTGVPMNTLIDDITRFAPVMKTFGFSMDESTALLGTLEKAGIPASKAMMSLNTEFKNAAKEGKAPKEALRGVVDQLTTLVKLGGPENLARANEIAVKAFGTRGAALFIQAIKDGRFSYQQLLDTMSKGEGAIKKVGDATLPLGTQLNMLKNQAILALAPIGEVLLPKIQGALKEIIPIIRDVVGAFGDLPPVVQNVGLIALAGIAAVGPLLKAFEGIVALGGKVAGFFTMVAQQAYAGVMALQAYTAEVGLLGLSLSTLGIAAVGYSVVKMFQAFRDDGEKAGRMAKTLTGQVKDTGLALHDVFTRDLMVPSWSKVFQKGGVDLESFTALVKNTGITMKDVTTHIDDNHDAWDRWADKVEAASVGAGANIRPSLDKLRQAYITARQALEPYTKSIADHDRAQVATAVSVEATSVSTKQLTTDTQILARAVADVDYKKKIDAAHTSIDVLAGDATRLGISIKDAFGQDKWDPKAILDATKAMEDFATSVTKNLDGGNIASITEDALKYGGAGIKQWYRDQIRENNTFTAGIMAATKRGLDPEVVSQLMTAGPAKANPILKALLSDTSGTLIKQVTAFSKQVERQVTITAAQARLIWIATQGHLADTDTGIKDLAIAQQLAYKTTLNENKMTDEELAVSLHIDVDTLRKIAQEFGITWNHVMPKTLPGPKVHIDISEAYMAGVWTDAGFAKGVRDKLPDVQSAGFEIAVKAMLGANSALESHSPSKAMERIGFNAGEGFRLGLLSTRAAIQSTAALVFGGAAAGIGGTARPTGVAALQGNVSFEGKGASVLGSQIDAALAKFPPALASQLAAAGVKIVATNMPINQTQWLKGSPWSAGLAGFDKPGGGIYDERRRSLLVSDPGLGRTGIQDGSIGSIVAHELGHALQQTLGHQSYDQSPAGTAKLNLGGFDVVEQWMKKNHPEWTTGGSEGFAQGFARSILGDAPKQVKDYYDRFIAGFGHVKLPSPKPPDFGKVLNDYKGLTASSSSIIARGVADIASRYGASNATLTKSQADLRDHVIREYVLMNGGTNRQAQDMIDRLNHTTGEGAKIQKATTVSLRNTYVREWQTTNHLTTTEAASMFESLTAQATAGTKSQHDRADQLRANWITQWQQTHHSTVQEATLMWYKLALGAADGGARVGDRLAAGLRSQADKIRQEINTYTRDIRDPLNSVLRGLGIGEIPAVSAPSGGRVVQTRNKGGMIDGGGPDEDSVLAYLTPGEFVVRRRIVDEHTPDKLHALNEGRADIVPRFNGGGQLSADQIRRGMAYGDQQAGKPYVWGSTGPGGFDCSGLASSIIDVILGQNPRQRLFTSASLVGGGAGLAPGLGQVAVGAENHSGKGHVAITVNGKNYEATPPRVLVGPSARGADNPMFNVRLHLGSGAFLSGGGGGGPSAVQLRTPPRLTGAPWLDAAAQGAMDHTYVAAQKWVNEHTQNNVGDPSFGGSGVNLGGIGPVTGGTVARIEAVIKAIESGGNYSARNRSSSAAGAYQFTSSTWRGLGGRGGSAADASPAEQDAVAARYIERILASNGGNVVSVPATWYVGHYDPSHLDYVPAGGNRMTVRQYIEMWMGKYGQTAPSSANRSTGGGRQAFNTGGQVRHPNRQEQLEAAWYSFHPGQRKPTATTAAQLLNQFPNAHLGDFDQDGTLTPLEYNAWRGRTQRTDVRGWNWKDMQPLAGPPSDSVRRAFPGGLLADFNHDRKVDDAEWSNWMGFQMQMHGKDAAKILAFLDPRHHAAPSTKPVLSPAERSAADKWYAAARRNLWFSGVAARDDFNQNARAPHNPGDVQAEDGSWVPRSFYGHNRGGIIEPARSFDSGGVLEPGWNRNYNGTGKPEILRPVTTNTTHGGSNITLDARMTVQVNGGSPDVASEVRKAIARHPQDIVAALERHETAHS